MHGFYMRAVGVSRGLPHIVQTEYKVPMVLNVDLDEDLTKALRRYAAEGGRTYTGIARLALRRLIPRRFFDSHPEEANESDTAA